MTGRPVPDNGNGGSSVSYLARTPCVPSFYTLFNRAGNRKACRLPGEGGDHFHWTVEPPHGHIWCRENASDCNGSRRIFPGLQKRRSFAKEVIRILCGSHSLFKFSELWSRGQESKVNKASIAYLNPELLQSRFGVTFLLWPGEFQGFSPHPQKKHSRPKLSAFPSKFT